MQLVAGRAYDHSDVSGLDLDRLARGRSRRGGDAVAPRGEVPERHGQGVADSATADLPLAGAGQIVTEQAFDQFAGGGKRQWLAFIGPILELDEAPRLGAIWGQAAELGELADR